MKAISIRQPWAWLIVHGGKDIENRSWETAYRGPLLIHAARTMIADDYDTCYHFCLFNDLPTPPPFHFFYPHLGGVVGAALLVDCVQESASPWFMGEWGFVLTQQEPIDFYQCKGQLGIFNLELP